MTPATARPWRTASWLLSAALGLTVPPAHADVIERILLKVNGDPFMQTELEQRQLLMLRRQSGRECSLADLRTNPETRQRAAAVAPGILSDVIDELLMLQRAGDLGYDVADADVDRVIESIKTENNIASKQQFDELLRREGVDLPMLRASLARQILIQQVRQSDVFRNIRIAEEEARAFHAARAEEFAVPAAVTFREIVVGVPPARTEREARTTQAQRDAALIRFVAARDRVRNGADFASVARDFSEAPSAAAGGLVGPVGPSELPETARRVLSELGAGDVSEAVSIDGAYALLKLETWTDGETQPFEKIRDAVIARLTEERQHAELQTYLRRLRASAIIEWKSADLKSAYERHLAQP